MEESGGVVEYAGLVLRLSERKMQELNLLPFYERSEFLDKVIGDGEEVTMLGIKSQLDKQKPKTVAAEASALEQENFEDTHVGEAAAANDDPTATMEMKRILIDEYKKRLQRFRDPGSQKKLLWREVAEAVNKRGFATNATQCDAQFRNLKQTYRNNRDRRDKTGKKRHRAWPFFDVMHEMMKDDDDVAPQVLASAGATPYRVQLRNDRTVGEVKTPANLPDESSTSGGVVVKGENSATVSRMKQSLASFTDNQSTEIDKKPVSRKRKVSNEQADDVATLLRGACDKIDDLVVEQRRSNDIMEARNDLLKKLLKQKGKDSDDD